MNKEMLSLLFAVRILGQKKNVAWFRETYGDDSVDALILSDAVRTFENEKGEWFGMLSVGELVVDRLSKVAELISIG
jgi:hypothetical protein